MPLCETAITAFIWGFAIGMVIGIIGAFLLVFFTA